MRYCAAIILILLIGHSAHAQRLNRFDRHGLRKGRWMTWQDSAKTINYFKGRYRKGNTVGRAYYYSVGGALERREISRFGMLRTTNYYPNGKVRSYGRARIENLPDRIHYYYYGRWKHFSEDGKPAKYCFYEKGRLVRTAYPDGRVEKADTLQQYLAGLEKRFMEKNEAQLSAINGDYSNIRKCEAGLEKLYASDSLLFCRVAALLSGQGYPPRARTGEQAHVPFFIMSYAPVRVRQQYEGVFIKAAGDSSLAWNSLANFMDRLRIARGEKQVYGTQYYFNKKREIVYYPIEDNEHLALRRKQIGLE